jgi:hypothetical protein
MFFCRSNAQNIDLRNKRRAARKLSRLGYSLTNASPGWYYNGSVYKQAAANDMRFSSEGGITGLLLEETKTNVCLYSSQDHASWAVISGSPTRASASSIIDGKSAVKYTAGATTDCIGQTVSTFSGTESYYVIVEQGTAATCDIEIYDDTAAGTKGRVKLTFSTGGLTTISAGTITATQSYQISSSGPNGGKVYLLGMSITSTGGNSRSIYFYPSTTAAGYTYWHHAQLEDSSVHSSPIVTTTASVLRGTDALSSTTVPAWWNGTEMSVYASFERTYSQSVNGTIFSAFVDGNNHFGLGVVSGNSRASVKVGGVSYDATSSAVSSSPITTHKILLSQKDGATYCSYDGTNSANAAQVGSVGVPATYYIGNFATFLVYSGRIFDLRFAPVAYSTTDMVNITT